MKKVLFLLACAALMLACQPDHRPFQQAQWIGIDLHDQPYYDADGHANLPATYLQRTFTIEGNIRKAELHIAGLGYSNCHINGHNVTTDIMGSLPSNYDRTVYYNTYDVTGLLQQGDNQIDVTLGSGYFVGMIQKWDMPYFGEPRLLAELHIRTSKEDIIISSDTTWQVSDNGAIVMNNLYDGETYDASKEIISDWQQADTLSAPAGQLLLQPTRGMQVHDTIYPIGIQLLNNGHVLVDMGTNMVGWLRINGQASKQPVVMRFAESLLPDSSGVYTANLRSARCVNTYIPADSGKFTYCPQMVYQGFRYVEIEGLAAKPDIHDLQGIIFYDDVEKTATFECSNPLLNQLFAAAQNGISGNYHGMPTDCPQRDERLGWLGDRTTGCYGESMLFSNRDFYLKFLQDIEDTQDENGQIADIAPEFWTGLRHANVTWTGAYVYIAHMLYERYNDKRGIQRHYDSMRRWLHYTLDAGMQDSVMTIDTYGDWCMPPENEYLIHSKDPNRVTEAAVLSTTVMYDILGKMQLFAQVMNRPDDAREYDTIAQNMKKAYNRLFYHADKGYYSNNTVTANILSYELGLVPDDEKERVMANIVEVTTNTFDSHVSCGVLGIQHLMRGLTRNGHAELAYTIATQTSYPSWGYMLRHGATTIWELWNGNTANPAMNSGNHVMLLGDLMLWYMEDLAGIRPASNGYRTLLMQPCFPKDLTFVKASYRSRYGTIASAWERDGNGRITWHINLPRGVKAHVVLPNGETKDIRGKQTLQF